MVVHAGVDEWRSSDRALESASLERVYRCRNHGDAATSMVGLSTLHTKVGEETVRSPRLNQREGGTGAQVDADLPVWAVSHLDRAGGRGMGYRGRTDIG